MFGSKKPLWNKSGFLILASFLLSACSSKSDAIKPVAEMEAERGEKVYVVSHGWHTGLVVSARPIQDQLYPLRVRFGDTPYIEFGWGDRAFYQAEEATAGLALKAILWPTESVIHAVAVPEKVRDYFPGSKVISLCLRAADYASLIRYISNSFLKNEDGELLPLQGGIYGNSQFYAAVGLFSLVNTCNSWTARGLQSAGLDISPAFAFTAGSVMDYLATYKQSLTPPTVVCH